MNGNIDKSGKAYNLRPGGFIFYLPIEIIIDFPCTRTYYYKVYFTNFVYEI